MTSNHVKRTSKKNPDGCTVHRNRAGQKKESNLNRWAVK